MDPSAAIGGWSQRLPRPLQRLAARRGLLASLLIAGIAIASWPVPDSPARPGLDPSFATALGYAVTHGQRFGTDLLYTYGPLGFLGYGNPWFGPLTLLALLFIGAVHVALVGVVVVGAARVLPLPVAAGAAYLAARDFRAFLPFEGLLILVTCAALAFLLSGTQRGRRLVAPVGGLAMAIGLLGKLNAGVFIAAIVVVAVLAWARPWWRGAIVLAGWSAAWLVSGWVVTGQGPGDVAGYVTGSFELISGFSQAMGIDPDPGQAWLAVAYGLEVLLVAALVVREAAGLPVRRRLGLAAVWVTAAFAFYKTGFVRWHVTYALALPVVAVFALGSSRTGRLVFTASVVAVLVPAIAVWGNPIGFANPVSSVRSLWHQAQVAARPWTWDAAADRSRAQLRDAYALEPEVLAALRGQTVHVDPWETAVVVAWPELRWQPLPVFQGYTAYTPSLDEQNAAALRGTAAPSRILRGGPPVGGLPVPPSNRSLDNRFRWWESPAAMLETFCRYDEVAATARWEVLALGSRRCGGAEPLGTVSAATGAAVAVPVETRPGRFVVVRVHGIEDRLLDRVVTTLFKSPAWWATVDGGAEYRLVPGTAADGLLLAVPDAIRRSAGFGFGPPIRQLAIEPRGGVAGPVTLAYEFLSVPLVGG